MKKYILVVLVLSSCVSSEKLFTSIEHSNQDNYGYSVENPILIGHSANWQKNTDFALLYLSKLQYNGVPLKLILHASVKKPSDQPRKPQSITTRWGTPLSLGAEFLDLYIVAPIGAQDTLHLYFDVEIKGEIKIPKGMTFDIQQSNNIFQ